MGDAIPFHGNPQDYPSVSDSNQMLTQQSGTGNDGNTQGAENRFSERPAAVDLIVDVEHHFDHYFGRQFEANIEPNIEPNHDHKGDCENLLKNLYNVKLKEGVYKVSVPVVVQRIWRGHPVRIPIT